MEAEDKENSPSSGEPSFFPTDINGNDTQLPNHPSQELDPEAQHQYSPIEIERKFVITEDCTPTIAKLGGKLIEEHSFQDVYYDTEDFTLTLNDFWLRSRDEVWQLKHPPENSEKGKFTTHYCETTEEDKIRAELSKLNFELKDLPEFTNSKCQVIASIRTDRKSYSLNDIRVCLDYTDFGFSVGELEIVVENGCQVSEAVDKINSLAQILGMKPYATFDFSVAVPDVFQSTSG